MITFSHKKQPHVQCHAGLLNQLLTNNIPQTSVIYKAKSNTVTKWNIYTGNRTFIIFGNSNKRTKWFYTEDTNFLLHIDHLSAFYCKFQGYVFHGTYLCWCLQPKFDVFQIDNDKIISGYWQQSIINMQTEFDLVTQITFLQQTNPQLLSAFSKTLAVYSIKSTG